MKFPKHLLLASLIVMPFAQQKPIRAELLDIAKPAAAAVVALFLGACGTYLILTHEPKTDKTALDSADEYCDQLKYTYNEELNIIEEYDRSRPYFYDTTKCNVAKQEKLRADLVEQALGRANNTDFPLHSHTTQLGRNLGYIQTTIATLKLHVEKLDEKIKKASGNNKEKYIQEKAKYMQAIGHCEKLKKQMATIRGALMRSGDYKAETYIVEVRKSGSTRWFSNKDAQNYNNTPPMQQQQQRAQTTGS